MHGISISASELAAITPLHLKTVLDIIPTGIEILRAKREQNTILDFEYIVANKAACRQVGVNERTGKTFLSFQENSNSNLKDLIRVMDTGEFFQSEVYLESEGMVHLYSEKYLPFGDGILIARENVKSRAERTLQELVQEAGEAVVNKNRELNEMKREIRMLNTVTAHDYKETLQQLYTNLEYIIVNDARNLSETGKTNIKRAQSALQKMNLLTDDINLYFNLYDMEVEMKELDLGRHVQEVVTRLQPKLDQINGIVKSADLPVILSHPMLLSQLLRSLVDNSIKYRRMSEQLVIEINYSVTEELVNCSPGKTISYGILSITDNGMGFENGHADKIFDLFYKIPGNGNQRGNGIGLALCKKIMSLHGGFITASADPAIGAIFNCYFPLSTQPAL